MECGPRERNVCRPPQGAAPQSQGRPMSTIHLVLLWHMHQPQYKDPATGRYVMPWTRLHALKDYWGMVRILAEFPQVHVTFNAVPSLMAQLSDYAGGQFDEPAYRLAFLTAEELTYEEKLELLERSFQLNHDTLLRRWPRFQELLERKRGKAAEAAQNWGPRDWRDLQVLSQLAWFDEEYLAHDPVISELSRRGANFTEEDKASLQSKELELLGRVIPEYRAASERGQIEISTTPFYHPILPLLCDTDIAREANPHTPLPVPPFRRPEDAREQLLRARDYHTRLFGRPPVGVWPSEGSVSDVVVEIAAELGFRWFATDEGVLGKTLNAGFWRDGAGIPANAEKLYVPLRVRRKSGELTGFFRDHTLSDLVGFVYSKMDQSAAAEDLHRRIRQIADRVPGRRPLTVTLILDGENAWEYYAGGGRRFLREFYQRIQDDPAIAALTASEAMEQAGQVPAVEHIAPGSWINANFDVWIGHAEDVRAWELLRNARDAYARAEKAQHDGQSGAPPADQLAKAFESLLAAEGSDWNWWYGPEHSTANDAEFDALYRKLLTEIYVALGQEAPEELAQPIKRKSERAVIRAPGGYLQPTMDGRETSYFEWMGAGSYAPVRQGGAMHSRESVLREVLYGFSDKHLFVRVDPFAAPLAELKDYEFRLTIRTSEELRVYAKVSAGTMGQVTVERNGLCLLDSASLVQLSFAKIFEVKIARQALVVPAGTQGIGLSVTVWEGGLPLDVLPADGFLMVALGAENFAWKS